MKAVGPLTLLVQLTRDTFRQAWASGISGMMLVVTAVCVLLCLSVRIRGDVSLANREETVYFLPRVSQDSSAAWSANGETLSQQDARREGVETISGRMTLGFGLIAIPMSRDRESAVEFLELILGGGIAGTFGLLMTLVWTSGFIPTFIDPATASVLLTKPASRTQLLVGKFLGVLFFVTVQMLGFVGGTWLALGVSAGVWSLAYWWSVPLLLTQFTVFYAFSVLLAMVARSTVACVFGNILFWCLAWGINYGMVMVHGLSESRALTPAALGFVDVAYWLFPKPIDAQYILFNAMSASNHFVKPEVFQLLEAGTRFSPTLSIASSFVFAAGLVGMAVQQFKTIDY